MPHRLRGLTSGLLSAALFGAAAPLSKLLLRDVPPVLLAGLFYAGAAAALGLALALRPALQGPVPPVAETPLTRRDLPLLLSILLLGGVAGPALLLFGLGHVSGFAGALLLNLEGPATLLLALLVFGEHLGQHEAWAALLLLLGAALLTGAQGPLEGEARGAGAIALACLCWGLDNNLTQRLSLRDPLQVSRAKALGAALCLLSAALLGGARLPAPTPLAAALLVGALSYGVSIALDVVALRELGAAQEAAVFAAAPFAGALLALPLLGERPGPVELAAALLCLCGVAVLLRARHAHPHQHERLAHDHGHTHDAHHLHGHDGLDLPRDAAGRLLEPHAHDHQHGALEHEHPHASDAHHRHPHD